MTKKKSAGRQTQDNSKSKGKDKGKRPSGAEGRTISENRKARHKFLITEQLECGIVLLGSEVKSLREGRMSLDEAWVRVRDGELWLVSADIPEYRQATQWNHEPKRPRKLLVHREQLRKLIARAQEKGLTLVPLRVWFNARGIVKVMVGVGRGKQLHDKRQTIKERETRRQIDRAMRGKPGRQGR